MNKEIFIEEVEKLGITLTDKMLKDLDIYYNLLVSYNEKVNLTAITEEKEVYLKHFYDSLTLIKAYDLTKNITLCDIGTGAGFPGIVLKIVFPNLSITLVDSLEKRIKFLNEVIDTLELQDIKAVHSRIEEFSSKDSFDLVVSRAVAKTNVLLELSCRLPKINGYAIFMKGNIDSEINESKNAIIKLNYKLINFVNFKLPIEESERNLIILKRIGKIDSKYPRDFAKIKKRPL